MNKKILLCVAFIVCFGIGFVCGMFAQSRIIDGCKEVKRNELIALFEGNASDEHAVKCSDGAAPDENGCCAGEVYTDMGDKGFNCCPAGNGDCFPPIMR